MFKTNKAATIRTVVLSATMAAILAACGSSDKMTTEKASETLSAYFKENKDICMYLGDWPLTVARSEFSPAILSIMTDSLPARLLALQTVGLATKDDNATTPKGLPASTFNWTPEGMTVYQQHDQSVLTSSMQVKKVSRKELCYATRTLKNVSKIEEKQTDGKVDRVVATFTLDIEPRGAWVTNKDIAKSFPEFGASLRNTGKELHRTLLLQDGKWVVSPV